MEALSVTGRYRVMRAEVSFMLFGFGRSGKGSRKEKPSGGFRGSLNDEVHGAHSDGENIILSAAAGGGSYPAKEAGQWVSDETLSGQYRLVFQPMNLKGQRTGGLLVSTNIVSRQVVLRVCGLRDVSGMLSAYTPDREDACSGSTWGTRSASTSRSIPRGWRTSPWGPTRRGTESGSAPTWAGSCSGSPMSGLRTFRRARSAC